MAGFVSWLRDAEPRAQPGGDGATKTACGGGEGQEQLAHVSRIVIG